MQERLYQRIGRLCAGAKVEMRKDKKSVGRFDCSCSGLLVCETCVSETHPVTGEPCTVLRLRRGGTGFSSNNDETLLATKKREGFQLG